MEDTTKTEKINNVRECFINYFPLPSLESLANVKIVTTMLINNYNDDFFIKLFEKHVHASGHMYSHLELEPHQEKMEKDLTDKLSTLPLPASLKCEASKYVRPAVFDMMKWFTIVENRNLFSIGSVCWTTNGTVDKAKSLKSEVNDKNVEFIIDAYTLACEYCTEDLVKNYWKQMTNSQKKKFYEDSCFFLKDLNILSYWTYSVENNIPGLMKLNNHYNLRRNTNHSLAFNMFEISLDMGSDLAIKYFWQLLTLREKNKNIIRWIANSINPRGRTPNRYQETCKNVDMFFFLLSQLKNKNVQKDMFKQYREEIFKAFLNTWPYQKLLIPAIHDKEVWEFVNENVFARVMLNIVPNIKLHKAAEDHFIILWCKSEIKLKKYFFQYAFVHDFSTFMSLVISRDIFVMVLDDADYEEKKEILSRVALRKAWPREFFDFIFSNKIPLFDTLKRITDSDESLSVILKNSILQTDFYLCYDWIWRADWISMEKFLTWGYGYKNIPFDLRNSIISASIEFGKYQLLAEFFNWCDYTDKDIEQLKREYLVNHIYIAHELIKKDIDLFDRFILWGFNSNGDRNCHSLKNLPNDKVENIIWNIFEYGFNSHIIHFHIISRVLKRCFNSDIEIKSFKERLIVSEIGMNIFELFVSEEEDTNWELVIELSEWFCPLDVEVIDKFKEKVNKAAKEAESYINNHQDERLVTLFYLSKEFCKDRNRIAYNYDGVLFTVPKFCYYEVTKNTVFYLLENFVQDQNTHKIVYKYAECDISPTVQRILSQRTVDYTTVNEEPYSLDLNFNNYNLVYKSCI